MTAFLIAMTIWLMAIPGNSLGWGLRLMFAVALVIALMEHTRVLILWSVNGFLATLVLVVFGVTATASLYAHGFSANIVSDIIRQAYALCFVFVLSQLLRDEVFFARYVKFTVMFALAAAIGLCLVQLEVTGLANVTSPEALKLAKYHLQTEKGITLNSFAYSIAAAFLFGIANSSWSSTVRFALGLACALVLWLFASTASMAAIVLASAGVAAMWLMLKLFRMTPVTVGVLMTCAWFAAQLLVTAIALEQTWMLEALNDLTTGRMYMWLVALDVFQGNPVFGAGPFSWRDDLVQGAAYLTADVTRYEGITGGAYHSVVFTTLAERGLVGAAALFVLTSILFAIAAEGLRRWRRMPLPQHHISQLNPYLVVIAVLLTLMRGVGEYSGPFAYANAHADFAALSVVAILLASVRRMSGWAGVIAPRGTIATNLQRY